MNPDSDVGHHKAIVFKRALGFDRSNYVGLLQQLESKCLQAEAIFRMEDKYGKYYAVDINVEGVDDQTALIRTGWLVGPDSRIAQLTTLYIKKR